jgi:hypothetical protein
MAKAGENLVLASGKHNHIAGLNYLIGSELASPLSEKVHVYISGCDHSSHSLILRFIHLLQLSVFKPISPFTMVLVSYTKSEHTDATLP